MMRFLLPLILSTSARIFSVISNTVLAAAAEHERHMIGERTRHALGRRQGARRPSQATRGRRWRTSMSAQQLMPIIGFPVLVDAVNGFKSRLRHPGMQPLWDGAQSESSLPLAGTSGCLPNGAHPRSQARAKLGP
jgi:hypothetical protein